MAEVIPAILVRNYEELKNKLALVRGVASVVQIDICDGVYTPSLTWPFLTPSYDDGEFKENDFDPHFRAILNEREGLPFWEDMDFELDLMVRGAVENFDTYMKLGARRIIFHLEAVGEEEDFRDFLEGLDTYIRDVVEIGVAIEPSTPTSKLDILLPNIDFVQFMGNDKEGFSGVELDERVYEKIKDFKSKHKDVPVSVDIGVDHETAPKLIASGVDRLCAGSAIFASDDIMNAMNELAGV